MPDEALHPATVTELPPVGRYFVFTSVKGNLLNCINVCIEIHANIREQYKHG